MATRISRHDYAAMYGPTVGDRVRLADTDLIIEVERDLTAEAVVEGARDGRSVADMMEAGAHVVTREQCMEGVAEMIHEVQVEATFPDGTKLVTVHQPIR